MYSYDALRLKRVGVGCCDSQRVCSRTETCNRVNTKYLKDTHAHSTQQYYAAIGDCDSAEYCTGTSDTCPLDIYKFSS